MYCDNTRWFPSPPVTFLRGGIYNNRLLHRNPSLGKVLLKATNHRVFRSLAEIPLENTFVPLGEHLTAKFMKTSHAHKRNAVAAAWRSRGTGKNLRSLTYVYGRELRNNSAGGCTSRGEGHEQGAKGRDEMNYCIRGSLLLIGYRSPAPPPPPPPPLSSA